MIMLKPLNPVLLGLKAVLVMPLQRCQVLPCSIRPRCHARVYVLGRGTLDLAQPASPGLFSLMLERCSNIESRL